MNTPTPLIHLDAVPISETRPTVLYQAQVSLGLDIAASLARAQQHLGLIAGQVGSGQAGNTIALVSEAYLFTLLNLSTIQSPDARYLTPHRQQTRTAADLPDESVLIPRMYGSRSHWAGPYGSLAYMTVHLDMPSYLHPTDLASRAIECLIARNGLDDWAAVRRGDDDVALYNTLFTCLRPVLPTVRLLNFLARWLPEVMVQPAVHPVLLDIQELLREHMVTQYDVDDWGWQALHLALAPTVEQALTDVLGYALRPVEVTGAPAAEVAWVDALYAAATGVREDALSTTKQYIRGLLPPGGFNMLLVALATDLLSRAVILLTRNAQPTPRVRSLLYQAGLLLRRSNLEVVAATGHNIGLLSGITDAYPPQIRQLL